MLSTVRVDTFSWQIVLWEWSSSGISTLCHLLNVPEPRVPDSFSDEIRQLEALMFSARDPDGRAFVPLADALRRAGEMDRALAVVSEGMHRLPDFGSAQIVAGWVHREMGDAEAALDAFSRGVELDGENTVALRAAAELAREAGYGDSSIEFAERLAVLEGEVGATGGAELEVAEYEPVSEEAPAVADELVEEEAVVAPDVFVEEEATVEEPAIVVEEAIAEEEAPAVAEMTTEDEETEDEGEEIVTRTLAEIYVRQGHVAKAVEVYRRLSEEDPGNGSLAERIDELESSPSEELDDDSVEVWTDPEPVSIASLAPDGLEVLPITPIASLAPAP